MPTAVERQNLIAKIANFPAALDEGIAQFSESQLDIPVRAGEWTVRQIVHHVADAHINGYIRMKMVVTENNPMLKPYDQDAWAELADMKTAIQPSIQILHGTHARWASFLQSLPEDAWPRTGVHLENGLLTLDELLLHYVHHCDTHIEQIKQLHF